MAGRKRKPQFDVERVRRDAADRWPEILATLAGLDVQIFDGNHHPCPKCGGKDRCSMAYPERGGMRCNQCFPDKNGDGFAAIGWLNGLDFLESVAAVALHLGIEPTTKAGRPNKPKKPPAKWDDRLEFRPWNERLAALWCFYKKGITSEAIRRVGKLATFRDSLTVLAFPIWQPSQEKPVGAVLYRVSGAKIPTGWNDKEKRWERSEPVLVAFGSKPGICGEFHKLKKFPSATVWPVEGSTDGLALMAAIPPGEQDSHIVIWNANGGNETPPTWLPGLLAGRAVHVVRDCDESGKSGLEKWSKAIATEAEAVPIVLPYESKENHGADLRDFLNDPAGGWLPLLALAEATSPVDKSEAGREAEDSDDDPMRLAMLFVRRYQRPDRGPYTLRAWREEFWYWSGKKYIKLPDDELRAEILLAAKDEFERLYFENFGRHEKRMAQPESEWEKPPTTQKVTITLVSNVLASLKSVIILTGRTEQQTWME